MKKQYEQPMAEKLEFNYKETIVASNTPAGLKEGSNINGCYDGSNANNQSGHCTPVYGRG